MQKHPQILIIGGGPAGLMAAEALSHHNVNIQIFDQKPSFARKFLMAGKSGLNITHSEAFDSFVQRYGKHSEWMREILSDFDSDDVRDWCDELGIQTFVGSSGRVFPDMMKASPLLRAWLKRLESRSVTFHPFVKWIGFNSDKAAIFQQIRSDEILSFSYDAVIFAVGGGSWAKLGSDGAWRSIFKEMGIETPDFTASNCALECDWPVHFNEQYQGIAVKNICLSHDHLSVRGDFVITRSGIEGGPVYSLSSQLLEAMTSHRPQTLVLDLLPNRDIDWIHQQLLRPRGRQSWSTHIGKTINIKGVKLALLRHLISKQNYMDPMLLSRAIKALPLPILGPGPLDRAISTRGGLNVETLDENLMLKTHSGLFCCGEMLDWDAPTGGYLLTACLAQGLRAGKGVTKFLGL